MGEVVLTVEELFQVVLDGVRVEGERLLALGVLAGVPSIEWPVSSVNGKLRLLENL